MDKDPQQIYVEQYKSLAEKICLKTVNLRHRTKSKNNNSVKVSEVEIQFFFELLNTQIKKCPAEYLFIPFMQECFSGLSHFHWPVYIDVYNKQQSK